MGILDFLNGSPGGMAGDGMGPPSQGTPGFFDQLGAGFAGGGMQIDPATAAQLGIDTGAIKRQQGHQALLRMLAAMGSATGNRPGHNASFGDALNAGLSAGLNNQGPDPMQQALAGALQSAQIARMMAQGKREDSQNKATDAFTSSLQGSPPSADMAASMGMSPAQLSAYAAANPSGYAQMAKEFAGNQATASAQAAKDAKGTYHEVPGVGLVRVMPDGSSQVVQGVPAAKGPAGPQLPAEWAMFSPEQKASYLNDKAKLGGAGGSVDPVTGRALSKTEITAANRRSAELQKNLDTLQSLSTQVDAMDAGMQTGAYDTGGDSLMGRLGRSLNVNAPAALRSGSTNEFDKQSNELALKYAATVKGMRGSNMTSAMIVASKPSLALDSDTNKRILADYHKKLLLEQQHAQAELDHYAAGGAVTSYQRGGASTPDGAGAAPTTKTIGGVTYTLINGEWHAPGN